MITGIKLFDFLTIFDFTYFDANSSSHNTDIVRIYYDKYDEDKWIELGLYDWGNNHDKIEILKDTLSKEILDMYIYTFRYNDKIRTLCIYCQKEKEIREEE